MPRDYDFWVYIMMGTANVPKSKVGRKDATNSRDARKRGKSDDGISASRMTEA
jgi:hypothetical protein